MRRPSNLSRVAPLVHLARVTAAFSAAGLLAVGCGSSTGSTETGGDSGVTPDGSSGGHDGSTVDAKGGKDAGADGSSTTGDAATEAAADTGVDAAAQCSDGVKDGDETDVDCGGATCDALGDVCAVGQACAADSDCKTGDGCNTSTHKCDPNQCHDGIEDGMETDVDCGGPVCDAAGSTCTVGEACATDADCTSGGCDPKTQLCAANQCSDGIKDGKETDVDCGGAVCDAAGATCALGKTCAVDADCSNGGGCDVKTKTCVATTCSDGIMNGTETGTDCGGTVCDALGDLCGLGVGCATSADCANGGGCDKTTKQCDATQCNDGMLDGTETGVDCGGATCDGAGDTCGNGAACVVNGDCTSGNCCGSVCSLTVCPVTAAFPPGELSVIDNVASPASGTQGESTLTLGSSAGFTAGEIVFVQQVQGTAPVVPGVWELATIVSVSMGVATLAQPLQNSYSNSAPATAQAIVVPQYTTVDVPATAALSAPAWNGSTGGVLIFQATGAVTIEGKVNMDGGGFRGEIHDANSCPPKACTMTPQDGYAGESVSGPAQLVAESAGFGAALANGGGGGTHGQDCAAGGGGAYDTGATAGASGTAGACVPIVGTTKVHGGGLAGGTVGGIDLSNSLLFGGAGGEGGPDEDGSYPGSGGNGGGAILILAPTSVTVATGAQISANGKAGGTGVSIAGACSGGGSGMGGGGGGAGGSIRIVSSVASLGTGLVEAVGASGGLCSNVGGYPGGVGGNGRVQVTSANITGTTNPNYHP